MDTPINVWNDLHNTDNRVSNFERPWYVFAKKIIEEEALSGRAIDIGCGVGEFMSELYHLGFSVDGVDGNPNQVKIGEKKGFKTDIADFEKALPFSDNTYDIAICLEVVEHIARAEYFLKEINRILTPSGKLLISTPNFNVWQNRFRVLIGKVPPGEGIHLRFFNSKTFLNLLRKSGFKVIKKKSFGTITGVNFMRRLFKKPNIYYHIPESIEAIYSSNLVYLCEIIKQ